jgi:hypothetical protein
MKTVNLSEEAYNKLKDKLVNEISYGTVDKSFYKSEELFGRVKSSFDDFYGYVEDAINRDMWGGKRDYNPYLLKIKKLADIIGDIISNKIEQQNRFSDETNSVDSIKFYDSEDAENNDIDDMELRYLQDKYPKA